jgi:hypothetical protein
VADQPLVRLCSHIGSGGGGDALVIVLGARTTGTAARAGRFFRFVGRSVATDRTDSGRKEVGDAASLLLRLDRLGLLFLARPALEPLAARTILTNALVSLRPIVTRAIIARPLLAGPIVTRAVVALPVVAWAVVAWAVFARTVIARAVIAIAVAAVEAVTARLAILALGALRTLLEAVLVALAVHQLVVPLVIILVAGRTLVFEAGAGFPEHAEIVIRELEIIFGLDTVAGELGVAGHVLVLFEQLRGIAAAALVTAVAASAASPETLRTLTPTTATAAALAIVHQARRSLNTGAEHILEARELRCRDTNRSLPGAPFVFVAAPAWGAEPKD